MEVMNLNKEQLQEQIKMWEKFNFNGAYNEEIAKAKAQIEELELEELQEEKNLETMMLCSHKDLIGETTNTQYVSYSFLVKMGFVDSGENPTGEYQKFLYAKDLESRREELISEGIKVPSKRVLEKDIKFLSQLGYVDIINTRNNGLCYIIRQSVDGKYFITIPYYKWRELVDCLNKSTIRLFVILSIKCNYIDYTMITREYLCKCLGIEPTINNQKYIGRAIKLLKKAGQIDVRQKRETIKLDNGNLKSVTHNYYRLTTYEEWKNKE